MGGRSLLQEIVPARGWSLRLLRCRRILHDEPPGRPTHVTSHMLRLRGFSCDVFLIESICYIMVRKFLPLISATGIQPCVCLCFLN